MCEDDRDHGQIMNVSLARLDLSRNRLTQFPDSLLQLKRLKVSSSNLQIFFISCLNIILDIIFY